MQPAPAKSGWGQAGPEVVPQQPSGTWPWPCLPHPPACLPVYPCCPACCPVQLEALNMDPAFLNRNVNEGFSGAASTA